ncbi:hypothetical protein K435DRAFT_864559 [Dendrothele bispora CBS 962.96]|uniref:Uncharacterized protein n=1 Tax=Dendrothele bispora (strain CBS 962.96) TaxID=1314807 RepID=A0A4S8LLK5_DENBC|nr:hypothetical protein K435DRAFT_864559 [Dendrothele bispora CBS 962.96]
MTKAKPPGEKKRPGRKPWYYDPDKARENWLREQIPERDKCKTSGTITQFYTSTSTRFLLKFGEAGITGSGGRLTDIAFMVLKTLTESPATQDNTQSSSVSGDTSGTGTYSSVGAGLTQHPPAASSDMSYHESVDTASSTEASGVLVSDAGTQDPSFGATTPVSGATDPASGGNHPGSSLDNRSEVEQDGVEGKQSSGEPRDEGLDSVSLAEAAKHLGWRDLSSEEFDKKKKLFTKLRKNITVFYQSERRTVSNTNDVLDSVLSKTKKKAPKPQRTDPVLVFQSIHYHDMVKETADREWNTAVQEYQQWKDSGDDSDERKPPQRVNINYLTSKKIFKAQTNDFKGDIAKAADSRFEEAMQEWEEKQKDPVKGEKTREERAEALKKWGSAVSKFTAALADDLQVAAFTAFVGEDPNVKGKVRVWWVHHGAIQSGLKWTAFDRPAYLTTEASFLKFGQTMLDQRNSGSNNTPFSSTGVSPNQSQVLPRERPGPGKNSSRMNPKLQKNDKSTTTNVHKPVTLNESVDVAPVADSLTVPPGTPSQNNSAVDSGVTAPTTISSTPASDCASSQNNSSV